jgi:hypothetical protein
MASEGTPRDPRELWQGQPTAAPPPSLEEVRRRALAFERTIHRRNLREYVAAVLVVLFFGWHAATGDEVSLRLGSTLVVAGTLFVVAHLWRKGSPAAPPAAAALTPCLDFRRAELERQRDLLRSVWWWYLLPLVPGLVVLLGGHVLEHPESGRVVGLFAAFCALLFLAVGWLNHYAARDLDREIDAMEKQR